MSTTQPARVRSSWTEPLLHTDLVWNPRVHSNVRSPKRGALVGTLYGLPVNGYSTGRGVVYQIAMITGEVRTVWWDGTIASDGSDRPVYPCLYDVDTGQSVMRNPQGVAWFALLRDIAPELFADA